MATNPNDEIREEMLRYFYDRNANATSERGKRGSQVRISDVKRELKQLHGLAQQQVMANLTYLVDSGWVERIEEGRTYRAAGGTQQPSTVIWHRISSKGIDLIEGGSSAFKRKDPYAGINITALDSTVQIGDGNVVNAKYGELYGDLDSLRSAVIASPEIEEADKFVLVADIQTLKNQLAKPSPSSEVVGAIWRGIQEATTVGTLATQVATLALKISALFS